MGLPEEGAATTLADRLEQRSEQPPYVSDATMPTTLQPPPRESRLSISQDKALSLIPVYRAIQIISSAVSQLTIDVERNNARIAAPMLSLIHI